MNFQLFTVPKNVVAANGNCMLAIGCGNVKLNDELKLEDVLYIPSLGFNLISIAKLGIDNNCFTWFSPYECYFQERTMLKTIGSARNVNGLFILRNDQKSTSKDDVSKENVFFTKSSCTTVELSFNKILLWHNRLGHPNFLYLKKLMPELFFEC